MSEYCLGQIREPYSGVYIPLDTFRQDLGINLVSEVTRIDHGVLFRVRRFDVYCPPREWVL